MQLELLMCMHRAEGLKLACYLFLLCLERGVLRRIELLRARFVRLQFQEDQNDKCCQSLQQRGRVGQGADTSSNLRVPVMTRR